MIRRFGALLPGAALCLALAACAGSRTAGPTTASPAELFVSAAPAQAPAASGGPALALPSTADAKPWTLADVLDVALSNHSSTRAAWFDAKAAAARLGMADAAYYPRLGLDVSSTYRHTRRSDLDDAYAQTTFGGLLGLNWLVADFGSRAANSAAAAATLEAANWTQNRAIHDLALATQKAYYLYLASKALRDAREVSLRRAEAHLAAAKARHEAGVSTLADVLSAQTAVSQARLALESARGSIEITRGSLAVAMGLAANTPFDVEALPGDLPYGEASQRVEELIARALEARPDLLAARAQIQAAEAGVRKARGEGLPVLNAGASYGATAYAMEESPGNTSADRREDIFNGSLVLTVPLFTGFSATRNVERAQAEAQAALERARGLEQQAVYQVFSGFHALKTASERVRAADDLLASALQSEEMASGRYREGVGTALDVVSAQAALADARAQGVQARWEWHTALAQLAHDAGILNLRGEPGLPSTGK